MIGEGQLASPERESEQVKVTVTLEMFHPAAFGAGDADAVMVGGVLSRLTVTEAAEVLPALSTAAPEIT
jgi:hypothetical protein